MKTSSLLSKVILFLAITISFISLGMSNVKAAEDSIQIAINPLPNTPHGAPRAPVFNPFYAQIIDNTLWIECVSSYGLVTIELTSTAGDNEAVEFDTDEDWITLPLSGESGHYLFTLTPESGVSFMGEFML